MLPLHPDLDFDTVVVGGQEHLVARLEPKGIEPVPDGVPREIVVLDPGRRERKGSRQVPLPRNQIERRQRLEKRNAISGIGHRWSTRLRDRFSANLKAW